MANTLIPVQERNLTPQEVEALDRRRRRGQLFLVLCFQCVIVGTLVTLWAGRGPPPTRPAGPAPCSIGTATSSPSPPSSASPASASAAAPPSSSATKILAIRNSNPNAVILGAAQNF